MPSSSNVNETKRQRLSHCFSRSQKRQRTVDNQSTRRSVMPGNLAGARFPDVSCAAACLKSTRTQPLFGRTPRKLVRKETSRTRNDNRCEGPASLHSTVLYRIRALAYTRDVIARPRVETVGSEHSDVKRKRGYGK